MTRKQRRDYIMKSKQLFALILSLVLMISVLSACKKEELISGMKEAEVSVYTTIYPIQFILEEIGGRTVNVQSVYPPGVDAHTYEPTSKDMTLIAKSDLFIYFGPSMEGFVESAANALTNEAVKLVSLEDYPELFETNERNRTSLKDDGSKEMNTDETNVVNSDDKDSTNHESGLNPHVWLDPLRMITIVDIITEQLISLNPKDESIYQENKRDLVLRLQKLDEKYFETLKDKEQKYMIVPHAAYGYWEERYGVEQIAISGLSPSEEPSQKYLTEIIQLADDYGVDYVFYEQNSPDKLIEIIQEQIGAEPALIHNLSVLTDDDLKYEEDYFTIMEYNLNVLNHFFN